MKYTKRNLEKLESVFEDIGFRIRYEKGHFKAGHCLVMNQKLVVINKFFDVEGRIQTLLDLLRKMEWEESLLSDSSARFLTSVSRDMQGEIEG